MLLRQRRHSSSSKHFNLKKNVLESIHSPQSAQAHPDGHKAWASRSAALLGRPAPSCPVLPHPVRGATPPWPAPAGCGLFASWPCSLDAGIQSFSSSLHFCFYASSAFSWQQCQGWLQTWEREETARSGLGSAPASSSNSPGRAAPLSGPWGPTVSPFAHARVRPIHIAPDPRSRAAHAPPSPSSASAAPASRPPASARRRRPGRSSRGRPAS